MTHVRLTDDGPQRFSIAGVTFDRGDEETRVREVGDDLAQHLVDDRDGFEYADEADAGTDVQAASDADADAQAEATDAARDDSGEVDTEVIDVEGRETDAEGVRTEEIGDEEAPPVDEQGAADRETDTAGERDTQTVRERDAETVTSEDVTPEADADDQQAEGQDETQDADAQIGTDALTDADRLGDLTVDEVEAALESGDHDQQLDEIEQAEREGKDRKGVHQAVDDRRGE